MSAVRPRAKRCQDRPRAEADRKSNAQLPRPWRAPWFDEDWRGPASSNRRSRYYRNLSIEGPPDQQDQLPASEPRLTISPTGTHAIIEVKKLNDIIDFSIRRAVVARRDDAKFLFQLLNAKRKKFGERIGWLHANRVNAAVSGNRKAQNCPRGSYRSQ